MELNLDLVAKTWNELGFTLKPMRDYVWVRAEPRKKGPIVLPEGKDEFFGQLPHKILIYARAIGIGPRVKSIKVGERVAFCRLFFGWYRKLEDGSYVGWILEDNIAGHADEESETAQVAAE